MKRSLCPDGIAMVLLLVALPCAAQIPQYLNHQGRVSVQGVHFTGTGQFKFALVDGGTNLNQTATATAVATVSVTSLLVNSGGSGYVTPPAVTIAPPDDPEGVQATAVAAISGGVVTDLTLTEPGSGYFNNPVQVTIAPPPENIEHQIYWSNAGDLPPGEVPATSVSLPVSNGLYSVRLGDNSLPNMAPFNPDIFYNKLFLRVWFDDGIHGVQQLTPDQALASAPTALHARLAETVPPGSIGAFQLANGAVSSFKLADGAVTPAKIADASIPAAKLATPAAPAAGQMLRFDGTQFAWSPDGLALPFAGAATTSNAAFSIQNNSNGAAIEATGTAGDGLKALTGGSGKSAVFGQNNTFTGGGQGVYGYGFFNATGVLGVSNGGDGVSGRTNGTGKTGVFGYAEGADSAGLHGRSLLHHGLYAWTGSSNRAAIWADAPSGAEAIHGHSNSGDGVVGFTDSGLKAGVFGFSNHGNGVVGSSGGSGKSGVFGSSDEELGFGGYFYNSHPDGHALKADGDAQLDGNVNVDGVLTATRLSATQSSNLKGVLGSGGFNWFASSVTAMEIPSGAGNIKFSREVTFNKDIEVSEYATPYANSPFWSVFSDERLKIPGAGYSRGLDEVTRIKTLKYRYKKGNAAHMRDDEDQIGVVAQEIQKVFPEAVSTSEKGYLTVNPTPVFWAMVNSIKELKAENDALKRQLRDDNASLRRRLEALERK